MLFMGSLKVFSEPGVPFSDVSSQAWYMEDLQYLLSHAGNIISGYPDGTFRPNDILTAEMFIKMTVTALGEQVESIGGYWAVPYIQKALQMGLIHPSDSFWPITGSSEAFEPFKKPITREGMALIAGRALDRMPGNRPYRDPLSFSGLMLDYNHISANARANVIKCYDLGVLSGYPDGEFKPWNQLTRAEAVSVIRRLIDPSSRKEPVVAPAASPNPTPIPLSELNRPEALNLGKGLIEVEGIRIDPALDYTPDGAMKLIKAEEFVNLILKYIRFYEDNGQMRMRGYIPQLPEGFHWSIRLQCRVEKPNDRGVFGGIYTNEREEQPEYRLPGESETFDLSLYTHSENISGLVLTCEILTADQKSGGRFTISFTDSQYTTEDFYGGFSGTYPFDTEPYFERQGD